MNTLTYTYAYSVYKAEYKNTYECKPHSKSLLFQLRFIGILIYIAYEAVHGYAVH